MMATRATARFLALVVATLATGACGSSNTPIDGSPGTDVTAADARDATTPPDARTDGGIDVATDATTPPDAPTSEDAPSSSDGSAVTDATRADATPTDAPVAVDARPPPDATAGGCLLPDGGTCPAGTSCPAGDGCNTCLCPARGGAALCTEIACTRDGGGRDAATGAECRAASDCTLFSSYCASAPCACLSLAPGESPPRCGPGMMVTCFVDPCRGRAPDCVSGVCTVR